MDSLSPANHPMAWADHGACRGVDPDVFYPPFPTTGTAGHGRRKGQVRPELLEAANRWCATCPVRVACHDWALRHERDGIWAGTDPAYRARMRKALGIEVKDPRPEPEPSTTASPTPGDDEPREIA